MADTCGPSNALQGFAKHTSIDRSLQQDRQRHLPARGGQTFPSQLPPRNSNVEQDFSAFQQGSFPIDLQSSVSAPSVVRGTPRPVINQPVPNWVQAFQQARIGEPASTRPAAPGKYSASHWIEPQQHNQQPHISATSSSPHQGAYVRSFTGAAGPAQGFPAYGPNILPTHHNAHSGWDPGQHRSIAKNQIQGRPEQQKNTPGGLDAAFDRAFEVVATRSIGSEPGQTKSARHESATYDDTASTAKRKAEAVHGKDRVSLQPNGISFIPLEQSSTSSLSSLDAATAMLAEQARIGSDLIKAPPAHSTQPTSDTSSYFATSISPPENTDLANALARISADTLARVHEHRSADPKYRDSQFYGLLRQLRDGEVLVTTERVVPREGFVVEHLRGAVGEGEVAEPTRQEEARVLA